MTFECTKCRQQWTLSENDFPFVCACGARFSVDGTFLPSGPATTRRVANYVKASLRHALTGFHTCTQEQIDARLAICRQCSFYNGKICTHQSCGCRINESRWLNKLAWADQECPIGKWEPMAQCSLAIISPNLNFGGAERWCCDIAKLFQLGGITVKGIGSIGTPSRLNLLDLARKSVAVRIGLEACLELVKEADITIAWGTGEIDWPSEKFVYVSHGGGPAAARSYDRASSAYHGDLKLVAVSGWAGRVFRGNDHTVIYNGVDMGRLVSKVSRQEIRRQWGLDDTDVAIGHIGRICNDKNPLAAAVAAVSLGRGYRAVYCGGGTESLVRLVSTFPGSPVLLPFREDVGSVYAGLDAFVLASPSEGFSLALTEAWAAGVPAVCTPVGAVPELEEKYGPLVVRVPVEPSGCELAEGVRQALSPENMEVVKRAQRLARKEFTLDRMGSNWIKYIRAIS